jgi:hypothetical protein
MSYQSNIQHKRRGLHEVRKWRKGHPDEIRKTFHTINAIEYEKRLEDSRDSFIQLLHKL